MGARRSPTTCPLFPVNPIMMLFATTLALMAVATTQAQTGITNRDGYVSPPAQA